MKAQETTFQKIIEGQRQFQIPLYQRTFSWQEKELRKLWEDVLEQANGLQNGASDAGHFLGSIVLAPSRARLKPEIPPVGNYGIPIRDELELHKTLP